jgi:hypothetical protein
MLQETIMKRTFMVMFVLLAALTTILLLAQEKVSTHNKTSISSIDPAEDEMWNWMIGNWRGWSESPLGKTQDWIKCEWDLNQQFLLTHIKSQMIEPNREMLQELAEKHNTTSDKIIKMMLAPYSGKGYSTINQNGKINCYWFDSLRRVYSGSEIRNGNMVKMIWKEEGGNIVIERTFEKVGENKLTGTFKNKLPNGQVIEGRFEATRMN